MGFTSILRAVVLSIWIAAAADANAPAETARRPNVVILLADDAGWGDYGHSGNRQVATPVIDSLAKSGVSLDRFFVCPVCSPTRAEFLTGRYHPRGGVYGVSTGQERLDPDEKTIAEAFRKAGYATGAFGKWHNGTQWPYHPMARGFDEYFGHTSGHWGEYFDAPLEDGGRMVRTEGYIVDVCTDRALAFIEKHKGGPFFCYVPFTTPHSPWAVPDENWQRHKDKPIDQRATNADREKLDETRCVLAMMENQDGNVGRILAKLDELNLSENTIVLYFSDNGPNSHRWNGGMKGIKGGLDEGSLRSVCYFRWPGKLPAGHRVTQIAGAIDLLPTLLALTGIERVGDKPLDGRDLSPILDDKKDVDWPERMLFTAWTGQVSVRSQQHRLDAQGRLYDVDADPGQSKPLNDREGESARRMQEAARAWREDVFAEARERSAATDTKPLSGVFAGKAVDPRPIPVGYREFPITMLPARDGEPQGGVKRSSGAPNCSYFVNWKSKDDRMVWLVGVNTAGTYEVVVDYTCPVADAGATVELSFGGERLTCRVAPGWDPPLYTNQDTLPRPHGESPMKEFRPLKLGRMKLKQGEGPLVLRAVEIPGKTVMDVRRVTLTLVDEEASSGAKAQGALDRKRLLEYVDDDGRVQPVKTAADWRLRRAQILAAMQEAMGPLPDRTKLAPLDVQETKREAGEGYERKTLTFAAHLADAPVDRVPAHLYLPEGFDEAKPRAAMLVLHQTSAAGKHDVGPETIPQNRGLAAELARRGYVVLAPDYPSFGEYKFDFAAEFRAGRYTSGTMKGVFNHMRAVDLLQELKGVDKDRIGVIGHSLGGHNAMFLAAFDERVKVVVSSCGWTPFEDYYGGKIAGWTSDRYMPRLRDVYKLDAAKVPFDFYEVVAAIAPRPFFSNSPVGDSNFDVAGVKKVVPPAGEVYRLLAPDAASPEAKSGDGHPSLVVRYPDCGHDFPPDVRQEAYAFIDAVLRPR